MRPRTARIPLRERLLAGGRRVAEALVPPALRAGGGSLPRVFWIFALVFTLGMAAVSLVGDQGLIAYWRLTAEAEALRAKVARMEARREELRQVIGALNRDPDYIEQLARNQLGLVRPDEVVLQLPPEEPRR